MFSGRTLQLVELARGTHSGQPSNKRAIARRLSFNDDQRLPKADSSDRAPSQDNELLQNSSEAGPSSAAGNDYIQSSDHCSSESSESAADNSDNDPAEGTYLGPPSKKRAIARRLSYNDQRLPKADSSDGPPSQDDELIQNSSEASPSSAAGNDYIQSTEKTYRQSSEQCSSESSESDADDSDNDPLYLPGNEVDDSLIQAIESCEDNNSSEEDRPTNVSEKATKKRSRKIRQERKINRNTGKAYVTESGKQIKEKKFKRLTTCRSKCYEKIDEKTQKDIFETYWKMGSRDRRVSFITGLIMYEKPQTQRKRRLTPEKQKNRKVTFIYKIPLGGVHIQECKKCFSQIFDETPKFLWNLSQQILRSPASASTPDKRGKHTPVHKISEDKVKIIKKHLNSLPSYESYYCRKETSKKYLPSHLTLSEIYKMYCQYTQEPVSYTIYSKMFHESKLSIKKPKKDTCHTCDELKLKLTYADEEDEKAALSAKQEEHHKAAELAFETKRLDKQKAKDCQNLAVCTFDLQQCLPTPCLQTSVAFYKRQLWTYNLTVHNVKNDDVTCYLWYESLAKRGANEISSCIFSYLKDLPDDIEHVILYSDSCPGQNKNTLFLAMCIAAVNVTNIKILEHKFLVPGHSRMECDTDHGKIEKLKKRYHLPISHPHDWAQLIRLAGKKNPFTVVEMTQENFFNFAMLLRKEIQFKKCNDSGEKFVWQNVKWLRYCKDEPLKFFYKNSLQENEQFKVMNVSRRGSANPTFKPDLCYNNPLPICEKKKKDILSLFPYVPPIFHEFYLNLPSGNVSDPIIDSEDEN